MPPVPTLFRSSRTAVLAMLLAGTCASAQSGNDPCSSGQAQNCHAVSFRFGEYDVISNVYIFLTAGNQQPQCRLDIVSIRKRPGSGWLPSPIALDLLFRTAVAQHHQLGHLPCDQSSGPIPLQAVLSDFEGLDSLLFSLFSLLHLSDCWSYSIGCQDQGIDIEFLEFLDELLFD